MTEQHQPPTPPGWVVPGALFGLVSVALYVTGWLVAGLLTEGYDPLRQAISETFDLGAPALPRAIATAGLVVSSLGLMAFGPVLHAGLPGRSRLGPALASVSGACSLLVAVFPCTDGCPGVGTTTTDTLHVVFAATGYLALLLAPVATGWRLRGHLEAKEAEDVTDRWLQQDRTQLEVAVEFYGEDRGLSTIRPNSMPSI